MFVDEHALSLLLTTVEANPESIALRLHLAELYLVAGRDDEALDQARRCLGAEPASVGALRVAARAAESVGDRASADGYDRLLQALEMAEQRPQPSRRLFADRNAPGPAPQPEPVPVPVPVPVPETADELIDLWGDDAVHDPGIADLEHSAVTLSDVAGLESVKQQLEAAFLAPLRNPELRRAFGKSLRGGLLLWGPPGCGKTFVARAIAGELGAGFLHVGLSDVLDMYVGNSERNLASVFDRARRLAPCVLFLDEIDALGMKRTQLRGGLRNVVNQLLVEMDGVDDNNEGVYLLAATNHPWDLDSALLRSGRFDRSLLVLPPDLAARRAILESGLRDRLVDRVDLDGLASRTDGLSAADLVRLTEQAAEYALTDSIRSGSIRPISAGDLKKAAKVVKPSHAPWVETARNVARYGNDSGFYDDLVSWLGTRKR